VTEQSLRRNNLTAAPRSSHSPLVNIGTEVGRVLFVRQDSGQTVVLVALMFTVLMGFAALSIDVGRFYSERRFMQGAVDAAALACAYKYAQGGVIADAWQAADNVLQQRNLQGNPLGLAAGPGGVEYAALGSEVYDPTVAPQNLVSGILPTNNNGLGCRVAITVQVPTFLIKIVSPTLNTIPMITRGYAKTKTGLLPSVVKRYANPPGPGANSNDNQFHDHTMAAGADWACSTTTESGCTPASVGAPGREFVIFGQAAKATNDNSFRGYIGLDIRDFTTAIGPDLVHEQVGGGMAYNNVPATVNVQTLKDFEANWILEGYPGPDICVVELPNFKPCAQIAVINGSSSGQFVDDYESRFDVGDKLLLQLYDGMVKTVPDFTIASGTLLLPMDGTATSTVQYTYSFEFAQSGATVLTELVPDNGTMTADGGGTPNNPFIGGCATYDTPPDNFTLNPTAGGQASETQVWKTITTTNCEKGIYQAWLRGTSSAPYESRIHETLVNVNVGGQARDFSLATSDAYVEIAAAGPQVNFVIRTTTSSGGSTKWTGNNLLTLSWAKCPTTTNPLASPATLPCGIDGVVALPGVLPPPVPNMDPGENHTFNVDTLLAEPGLYKGWVRETGLDDITNKRVTHLLEVTVQVGIEAGGVTQYVDVIGYAVFEVTAINSNDVSGRAITGTYADLNDPALAIGRKIGLVPWETP